MTLEIDKDPKSVVIHARFTERQAERIDAAWKAEGFASRSAYLRHLGLVGIGDPSAPPAVIEAMRDARKELSAIGRNLNQAVREMNRQRKGGRPVDPAALVKVEDLEALNLAVRQAAAQIAQYTAGGRGKA